MPCPKENMTVSTGCYILINETVITENKSKGNKICYKPEGPFFPQHYWYSAAVTQDYYKQTPCSPVLLFSL